MKNNFPLLARAICLVMLVSACGAKPTVGPLPISISTSTTISPTPTKVWDALLEASPYPHNLALPDSIESALDGTYTKIDQSPPQWWACYRCADYRPMGGVWRMQFDKGVMRIYYGVTNWRSIASFTVSGNRLKIFNDPYCPQDVGEYEWVLESGNLVLKVIEDGCAFDLRKANLINQNWLSCASDGGQIEGCANPPDVPSGETPPDLPVTVTVHGGDSHYFDQPPDLYAVANKDNVPSPAGIQIRFHEESIAYGTHRVLWWKGDWIEATTDLNFTSIGVQLWGSVYLGWARVLFDGAEIWRGLTTSLGKQQAYYGGYIEISGFDPGTHTIRVENLGFDYHPIKVAAFGFSNQPVEK